MRMWEKREKNDISLNVLGFSRDVGAHPNGLKILGKSFSVYLAA